MRTSKDSLHDGMVGVDLQMFLGGHVAHRAGVPECLRLHDPLHVGGPAVLRGDDAAGRGDQSVRHDHLLDLLLQDVLDHLAQVLESHLQNQAIKNVIEFIFKDEL